jgi:predicted dehydrogenase
MLVRKPTVAVVGLGVGLAAHVPALRSAGFEVVALGARRRDLLEAAGASSEVTALYTNFDELLKHPSLDAVSIATPPPSHHSLVLSAIAARKHILVEKEFAMSTAQAREMCDAARASGVTAMVAQAYRFAPSRAYVGSLIESGYIGNPRQIALSFFRGPPERPPSEPRQHWRTSYASGGGMSGGQMATFFDAVFNWFGPVASIGGRVRVAEPGRYQANGLPADADDMLSATFETKSGVLGSIVINVAAPFGTGGRIEIYGSEGTLTITQPFIVPSREDSIVGGRYEDGPGTRPLPIPGNFLASTNAATSTHSMFESYWPLARVFREGIEAGSSPSPNFDEAFHLQCISDALRESSEVEQVITI